MGLDNTLRELCKEAGIPEKSFHDIRRTVASELFANGRTLEEIRKFLGHKDITTTQGYIYSLDKDSEYGKANVNSQHSIPTTNRSKFNGGESPCLIWLDPGLSTSLNIIIC